MKIYRRSIISNVCAFALVGLVGSLAIAEELKLSPYCESLVNRCIFKNIEIRDLLAGLDIKNKDKEMAELNYVWTQYYAVECANSTTYEKPLWKSWGDSDILKFKEKVIALFFAEVQARERQPSIF